MEISTKEKLLNKKRRGIPKALIYEMRHGSPIYYRDYDKVLKGEIPLEAVMGSSGLQAWLIKVILKFLLKVLDKNYEILSNEVGFKFAKKSWYNLDIAIWEKEKIKPYLKENKLIPVAPEVVIEVDTKADLRKFENPQDYFHKKTQDLLNAGVKKVIWIFTQDKKVWIAQPNKPWLIVDWDYDIPVLDNLKMNIEKLIKEEEENE
jgi:Uma2 family endonuclease